MARYPSELPTGDEVQGIEVQGQLENNGKYKMGYRDGECAASQADDITDGPPLGIGIPRALKAKPLERYRHRATGLP